MTAALKEWAAAVHAPTVAHSDAERVRPEHRDLLDGAAPDSTDERVVIRATAKVVAAVAVRRDEGLAEIEDLHIWTAESVRTDQLDFRPRHRLTVLVVQAMSLTEPIGLPREPHYGGCTSWVQLPVSAELFEPVHDAEVLAGIAGRVRAAVS